MSGFLESFDADPDQAAQLLVGLDGLDEVTGDIADLDLRHDPELAAIRDSLVARTHSYLDAILANDAEVVVLAAMGRVEAIHERWEDALRARGWKLP